MSHVNRKEDEPSWNYDGLHYQQGVRNGDKSVAPYVPTPQSLVNTILEIAEAGPGDVVYDLGCGDGRFLITAVKDFNVDRAVGYELNKHLYGVALNNVAKNGLRNRINVNEGDLMEADLSDATLIILYLTTSGNAKLRSKFREELKPGTRILSHDFPIMDWTTINGDNAPIRIEKHKIFYYETPDAYAENPEEKNNPPEDSESRIKKLIYGP